MVIDRRISHISSSVVKRVGAGWVDDTNGLEHRGHRSARMSHINFRRHYGLGRVGALGRRGGAGQVVVRAFKIWVGAGLTPLAGLTHKDAHRAKAKKKKRD